MPCVCRQAGEGGWILLVYCHRDSPTPRRSPASDERVAGFLQFHDDSQSLSLRSGALSGPCRGRRRRERTSLSNITTRLWLTLNLTNWPCGWRFCARRSGDWVGVSTGCGVQDGGGALGREMWWFGADMVEMWGLSRACACPATTSGQSHHRRVREGNVDVNVRAGREGDVAGWARYTDLFSGVESCQ